MVDAKPTTVEPPATSASATAAGIEITAAATTNDPRGRWIGVLGAVLIALSFSASLLAYGRDTYYQSHFVFLWLFFGAALWKAGRGRVAWRVGMRGARDVAGFGAVLVALGLLWVGLVTGSSTAQRLGLVAVFAAFGLLAMPAWSARRTLAYAAFAVLCFGLPYSAYFSLTEQFRGSFMFLLDALGGWLGYQTEGVVLVFPHYRLSITPDCSGFNQLITFFGLASLGSLTGRTTWRRLALLFGAGALLAYASNLFRVVVFVICVSMRQYAVIEDDSLHATVGFIAYAPFILGFLWLILRTHRDLPATAPAFAAAGRRVPIGALALPFVAMWVLYQFEQPPSGEAPAYTAGLLEPPGYVIAERASTGSVGARGLRHAMVGERALSRRGQRQRAVRAVRLPDAQPQSPGRASDFQLLVGPGFRGRVRPARAGRRADVLVARTGRRQGTLPRLLRVLGRRRRPRRSVLDAGTRVR